MAKTTTNNIQMNISDKTRYTINGNKDKYIELNPGDVGIVARLGDAIPIINGLVAKYEALSVEEIPEDEPMDVTMQTFSTNFKQMDSELRSIVNNLFDYDVCAVCAGGGSMFDPLDGEYRFSVIISTLLTMYEDTISKEMEKMVNNMKKHTDKYTAQDHKRKRK